MTRASNIGEELAHEFPAAADIVVAVPDSGVPAALGFSAASGLPFEWASSAITMWGAPLSSPPTASAISACARNTTPTARRLEGKRVVLVDDSIVRGTTSKKIVQMVRDAGAKEVHFRVASPPTTNSCFYGVDTPNTEELLAHRMDVEDMRRFIGADSLAFVSIDGLYRAVGEPERNDSEPQFCDACFSGEYPIEPHRRNRRPQGRAIVAAGGSGVTRLMSLKDRIALVTGASRGIGRAAALALAQAGAHVILVARTVGGLEEADDEIRKMGGSATLVPLDIKDFDALDRLGASIHERWGKLDAFLGNAGILGTVTPLAHLKPKVFQEVLDVNVTANWRLIRSLDPLLKKSDAGRVLFVSSGAARNFRPYWGAYSVSKAALEALALTYAGECENTPVRVNLLNPGAVRTGMRALAFPGEDPMTLKTPEALTPQIVSLLSPECASNGEIVPYKG